MNYNLKVSGVEASDEVRAYLERRLDGIDKLLGRREQSVRADVELSYLESEEKQFQAECTLHDGASLYAKALGTTLHEAIDKLGSEVTHELTKAHKKRLHVLRHSAVKVKEYLRGWRKTI